ncbi:hypothetical protein MMC07_002103 [Pseudocyphellaria aurata]|nr:hypothetical protein [Pseudocyphellaria aurata]
MENVEVPLQDQRVFGAGIKQKRVSFIPARIDSPLSTSSPSSNIGDRYLSIVLQDTDQAKESELPKGFAPKHEETTTEGHIVAVSAEDSTERIFCDICKLPMQHTCTATFSDSRPHEASLAHQACLAHSHPPSHMDRTRKGLQYLSSYGWDPDDRLGLGVAGEGIRFPLKVKPKNNTVGLGVDKYLRTQKLSEKKKTLNAKQVRENEQEARRKREILQELFYRDDEMEKYLGPK